MLVSYGQTAETTSDEAIRQLGSSKLSERLAISKTIWAAGEASLPSLELAERSADPEVALRASAIREKIIIGIRPDDPEDLIAIIESFYSSPENKQAEALGNLFRQKKYKIAVLLAERAKNPQDKSRLLKLVRGYAILEARLLITAGKIDTAETWLRGCTQHDSSIRTALANLLVSQGRFDAELQTLAGKTDSEAQSMRTALHAAAGNRVETLRLAQQESRESLSDVMELLGGNPLPLISKQAENTPLLKIYTTLQQNIANNQPPDPAVLQQLVKTANSAEADEDDAEWEPHQAMAMLFALGFEQQACSILRKQQPAQAFLFYAQQERDQEAFQQLDLNFAKPDYKAFVRKHIKASLSEESAQQNPLPALISWLEHRGLWQILENSFVPQLVEHAKNHPSIYADLVYELITPDLQNNNASANSPETIIRVTELLHAKDENGWRTFLNTAFPARNENQMRFRAIDKDIDHWWQWLGELEPESSLADRMRLLMRVLNLIPDPIKSRDLFLKKLTSWHEQATPEQRKEKQPLFTKLQSIAPSKLLEEICPLQDNDSIETLIRSKQWEKAAAELAKSAQENPEQPWLLVKQSICLRMDGKQQAADELEQKFRSLVLGDSQECLVAAQLYATYSLQEQALAWSNQALFFSNPAKRTWYSTLHLLSQNSLNTGLWANSAAVFESMIFQQMQSGNPAIFPLLYRMRMTANMARGLALTRENREAGIAILKQCHQNHLADASLADDFFPALRRCGLIQEHNTWFEESWQAMNKQHQRYPAYDNIENSMAWLASRAKLRLDEAKAHSTNALVRRPGNSAYLDTMAEIHFAAGDRASAVHWSSQAIFLGHADTQLMQQSHRFQYGKFPE